MKTFHLFSPIQRPYLYPYTPPGGAESSLINDVGSGVDENAFPCFKYAESMTVKVKKGDALFIPEGWWHQVQTEGLDVGSRSVAANLFFEYNIDSIRGHKTQRKPAQIASMFCQATGDICSRIRLIN